MGSAGCAEALVYVLDDNARGRRFYERAGFVAEATGLPLEGVAFDLTQARYRRALTARRAQPSALRARLGCMSLRRLSAIAASSAIALMLTASVAAADPPWSPPSALGTGVGTGPAVATPARSVLAFTTADRSQPPGTASQLLRLDPATGAVRSAAGVDLAGTAIAAYGGDHVAVAGTSIGPSGTVDPQSRVRAGTTAGASGTPTVR